MSESMAFIGGVAVAGLAALLLLKGTGGATVQQSGFSVTPPIQSSVVPNYVPPVMGTYNPYPQNPNPTISVDPNAAQKAAELERFKVQNEGLQRENYQLKAENQQLQFQLQQFQLNAQHNNQRALPQPGLQSPESAWFSSPIVWAVGGMSLAIGGGIVVAGVLALFSPKERSGRTVQVIHPYPNSTQPLTPIRRAEFLPPRKEVRRVQAPNYDDLH
ncbi:MAG: heterocyst differentiation related protein [Nostocaceae cyanobacterium]|nr:heterocyst differentiation related protein [Nostocaceae cyanobacterium]